MGVALFTLAYIVAFTVWFVSIGNSEFIVYVVTMVALVLLVALTLDKSRFTLPMLWALTLWGLLHISWLRLNIQE